MDSPKTMTAHYNDTVVRQFSIMAVVWGVVGMLVGVFIAAQLAWPELNFGISWLSYGLLRAQAWAAFTAGMATLTERPEIAVAHTFQAMMIMPPRYSSPPATRIT